MKLTVLISSPGRSALGRSEVRCESSRQRPRRRRVSAVDGVCGKWWPPDLPREGPLWMGSTAPYGRHRRRVSGGSGRDSGRYGRQWRGRWPWGGGPGVVEEVAAVAVASAIERDTGVGYEPGGVRANRPPRRPLGPLARTTCPRQEAAAGLPRRHQAGTSPIPEAPILRSHTGGQLRWPGLGTTTWMGTRRGRPGGGRPRPARRGRTCPPVAPLVELAGRRSSGPATGLGAPTRGTHRVGGRFGSGSVSRIRRTRLNSQSIRPNHRYMQRVDTRGRQLALCECM